MIEIKTPTEISLMAKGGAILAKCLRSLRRHVKPGITTRELDELAYKLVLSYGGKPAFLGYSSGHGPFPASLCASINEEIVHGIPSADRTLRDGDIVGLDFGVLFEGFYTDSAITVQVGNATKDTAKILKITEQALFLGIDAARAGNTIGDIGYAVQAYVEQYGFSVIRDLVGHGIGSELHAEPQVPNFGRPGEGLVLREGMVIAIEPMVSDGSPNIKLAPDGWTYKTADGSLSAHFEHTVAITKKGPKILTK